MMGSLSGEASTSAPWVVPALGGLVLGPMLAAWLAWAHLRPGSQPEIVLFLLFCLGLALTDFSLAVSFALSPSNRPGWWRPSVLGAVILLALVGVVTAAHHRELLISTGVLALLLAWNARLAETLGSQLAAGGMLSAGRPSGDTSATSPECTRIVLETWVLTAAATFFVGHVSWLGVIATSLTGFCGVIVVAGAKLTALRVDARRDGFEWATTDAQAMWGHVASLAFLAVVLGAIFPAAMPPVFSLRFLRLFGKLGAWIYRITAPSAQKATVQHPRVSRTHPTSTSTTIHRTTPPPVVSHIPSNVHTLHTPHWLHTVLAFLAAGGVQKALTILALIGLPAVIIYIFVSYLRETDGGVGGALQRLWAQIRRIFGFWQFFRSASRLGEPLEADPTDRSRARRPGPIASVRMAWAAMLDPRRAVRAAYREFLQGAGEAGHPIHTGQTPATFEASLSPVLSGERDAAGELTRAYEVARYSDHPVTLALVPRLRIALVRTIAALRGAPPPPPSGRTRHIARRPQ